MNEEIKNVKPYGLIYKTTNLINDKIYIGQTSKDLDNFIHNKYFGSGKLISKSLRKNKKENFKKEIICYVCSKQELDDLEQFYIKQFNSLAPNGYNLQPGGKSYGKHHEESKKKMSKSLKQYFSHIENRSYGEKNGMFGKTHTDENKKKTSKRVKDLWANADYRINNSGENTHNYGKICITNKLKNYYVSSIKDIPSGWEIGTSDITKKNISKSNKGKLVGNKNPQFGKKWITNLKESKRININEPLPEGWQLGIDNIRNNIVSKSHKKRWDNNTNLREEYSKKFSGRGNGMYGKTHGKETKERLAKCRRENKFINNGAITKSIKRNEEIPEGWYIGILYKKFKCPYCNLEGRGPNMTRYHFNNCKILK